MARGKQVRRQSLTLWHLCVLPITSPCSLGPGQLPSLCWGRVLLSFQPLTPRQGAGVAPHRETPQRVLRHGQQEWQRPHPHTHCHSCFIIPAPATAAGSPSSALAVADPVVAIRTEIEICSKHRKSACAQHAAAKQRLCESLHLLQPLRWSCPGRGVTPACTTEHFD